MSNRGYRIGTADGARLLLAAIFLIAGSGSPGGDNSFAADCEDQIHVADGSYTIRASASWAVAQTFTVGVAGELEAAIAQVDVIGAPPGSLLFELRSVNGGIPDAGSGGLLASGTFAPEEVAGAAVLDLAGLDLAVAAGDRLAIVLDCPECGDAMNAYRWSGTAGNSYPHGTALFNPFDSGWSVIIDENNNDVDLGFVDTLVCPTPAAQFAWAAVKAIYR